MSLVGLVNLAERLLNQGSTQGQDTAAQQKAANPQPAAVTQGPAEDLFTPSAQNGQAQATEQDAGLFNVAQFTFFSAAADFLLGQGTQAATVGTATNGGGNTAAASGAAQTTLAPAGTAPALVALVQPTGNTAPVAANQGVGALANAANTQAAAPATDVAATTNANATAAPQPTGSLAVQQQLQALNTALAALGLDPQEIQQLDQIASVINDFNPNAFTSLAYQIEELAQAQQAAQPTPANEAANGNPATNANVTPANGNGAAGSAANVGAGGFQVQELAIQFASVQAQATAGGNGNAPQGAANGNATVAVNAFNLQIEAVNLTLVNGNGQVAQIQAPGTNRQQPTAAPKAQAANA